MCYDNTISLRTVQQIVNRSAKRQDKRDKKWFKKIDVDTFDANMSHLCIVGQLGLSDNHMDQTLGYHIDNARKVVHKGKVVAVGYYDHNIPLTNNEILTRLWKHQINARLRKASKSKAKPRKVAVVEHNKPVPAFHGC